MKMTLPPVVGQPARSCWIRLNFLPTLQQSVLSVLVLRLALPAAPTPPSGSTQTPPEPEPLLEPLQLMQVLVPVLQSVLRPVLR
jgi:hypothetical protein